MLVHTFFDGVAIVRDFLYPGTWPAGFPGDVLHKIPRIYHRFHRAKYRTSPHRALAASALLGVSTLEGLAAFMQWVSCIRVAAAAVVRYYVAATDLMPK
jgi:hypothetical protein